MRQFQIATGISRNTKIWKNTVISWNDLVNRLSKTVRTPETQGEFKNLPKSKQDEIKDVGGFVGGSLKNGKRKNGCVNSRSLITLDADFASEDFCETVDMFAEYTYCIYSTHKHTRRETQVEAYSAAVKRLHGRRI